MTAKTTINWKIQDLPAAELIILGVLFIGAKTTVNSGLLINTLSYGLIALGTVLTALRLRAIAQNLIFSFLALSVYLIGCGISYLKSPSIFPPENIAVMSSVIFSGSLAITTQKTIFESRISINITLLISLAYLTLTSYAGGIVFDSSPKFIFDTFNEYGLRVYDAYSQGISKVFGIICLIFLNYHIKLNLNKSNFYILFSILFFMVCLIGGARGELIALVFCIVLYLANLKSSALIIFFLISVAAISVLPQNIQDQFIVLDRLSNLGADETLGGRRELFSNSLLLIENNKICLLFGCGLQFFQDFWGYRITQYPHNYILDLIISYGVVVTLAIYFIYFRAIYVSRQDGSWGIFAYIAFYLFIISMKSGSPIVDHLFWIFLARQIQLSVGRSAPHMARRANHLPPLQRPV